MVRYVVTTLDDFLIVQDTRRPNNFLIAFTTGWFFDFQAYIPPLPAPSWHTRKIDGNVPATENGVCCMWVCMMVDFAMCFTCCLVFDQAAAHSVVHLLGSASQSLTGAGTIGLWRMNSPYGVGVALLQCNAGLLMPL